jgi:hypothetical protein
MSHILMFSKDLMVKYNNDVNLVDDLIRRKARDHDIYIYNIYNIYIYIYLFKNILIFIKRYIYIERDTHISVQIYINI